MHSAIAETRVLYATASVHEGWHRVKADGLIPFSRGELSAGTRSPSSAYDGDGFWIQNSWGEDWGRAGFCQITYDDWLVNAHRRLGGAARRARRAPHRGRAGDRQVRRRRPVLARTPTATFARTSSASATTGCFAPAGRSARPGTTSASIFAVGLRRGITQGWETQAPAALCPWRAGRRGARAIQRLADLRASLLEAEVYPISFIWQTDFWSTVTNILRDALRRRRPEGIARQRQGLHARPPRRRAGAGRPR